MNEEEKLNTRIEAAYHEAGHAVVALLYHASVSDGFVDQEGRGCVHLDPRSLNADSETIIAMAGPAAEYFHTNPSEKNLPPLEELIAFGFVFSDTDAENAFKHSQTLSLEDQRRFRQVRWDVAGEMLREHWRDVEIIANAFVEREHLTVGEMKDLLHQE